ncbi:MAG: zinc-dependent peptidase [Rhodanobacteraceae bacterium]|nr:zinc-dependent peptidase [Rhodanobacteraceae bacterium]
MLRPRWASGLQPPQAAAIARRRLRPCPRPRPLPHRKYAAEACAGSPYCRALSSNSVHRSGLAAVTRHDRRVIDLFRRLREHLRPRPAPIDDTTWTQVVSSCALVAALSPNAARRLRELCARFLADKQFSALGGAELDDYRRLLIAALACLPVLDLGYDYLRGWRQVLVYPGEFRVRREHHDEDTGVVTEGDDTLIGEAWEHGPLVLSWADIEQDLAEPHAGFNVVIHEIAHKLDMLGGGSDGVPPLPRSIARTEWIRAFQQAYDAHCAAVDAGVETAIDPYAAESPDEFFACLVEAWHSAPTQVETEMPAVAALLQRLFRPDPSATAI